MDVDVVDDGETGKCSQQEARLISKADSQQVCNIPQLTSEQLLLESKLRTDVDMLFALR